MTSAFTSNDIVTNSTTVINDISNPFVVREDGYFDVFIPFTTSSIGSVNISFDDSYSAWTRNDTKLEKLTNAQNIDKLHALHLSFYDYLYDQGESVSRSIQLSISATTTQGNIHKYAVITLNQYGCIATYKYKLNTNAFSTAYTTVNSTRIDSGEDVELEGTDEVFITINPAQKTYSGITTGYCEFFGFVTTGIDRNDITEISRADNELRYKFTMPSNDVTLSQDFEQYNQTGQTATFFINTPVVLNPSSSPIVDPYCGYFLLEQTTNQSIKSYGYYVSGGELSEQGRPTGRTDNGYARIVYTFMNRTYTSDYGGFNYITVGSTISLTFNNTTGNYELYRWKIDRLIHGGGVFPGKGGSGFNGLLPLGNGEYGNNYLEKNYGITLTGDTCSLIAPNFNFSITPVIRLISE